MHTLSRLFLSGRDARLFGVTVSVHLVSVLISYALAGAMALQRLFGLDDAGATHQAAIALFTLAMTGFLFGFARRVALVVSLLTAVKLALILFMVIAVAAIAAQTQMPPAADDWRFVAHPFLLSTVALGGAANLMPVMARSIPAGSAAAQRRFLAAVSAGLIVCWALNVGWAASVLLLVPQTAAQAAALGLPPSASLQSAAASGQISTVPVAAIIDARFPQLRWVAAGVSFFIALSISVSFVIMGTGLKSVLEGVARHWHWPSAAGERGADGGPIGIGGGGAGVGVGGGGGVLGGGGGGVGVRQGMIEATHVAATTYTAPTAAAAAAAMLLTTPSLRTAAALVRLANVLMDGVSAALRRLWTLASASASRALRALLLVVARALPALRSEEGRRALLFSTSFGLVLVIALANPSGFVASLEIFTSLALNLSCGWLVAKMFVFKAAEGDAPVVAWAIPAPWRRALPAFALASFGAAVIYDLIETLARLTGWSAALLLALAAADLVWHERWLRRVVEWLLPPAGAAHAFAGSGGASGRTAHDPFLRIVLWANMAILEALAFSSWSGIECSAGGDESPTLTFWFDLAVGGLLSSIFLNEAAAVTAVVASGLGPRRDLLAWALRRAPVGLAYTASLAATGGAISLSACGCGASASVAWYAVLMSLATVAAAFVCAEASDAAACAEGGSSVGAALVGGGGGGGGGESERGTLLAVEQAT